jgi:hypothetical protein
MTDSHSYWPDFPGWSTRCKKCGNTGVFAPGLICSSKQCDGIYERNPEYRGTDRQWKESLCHNQLWKEWLK